MGTSKDVQCVEVIISKQLRRGSGKSNRSPIRAITQVFTKNGDLIAEHDPCPENFTPSDLVKFAQYLELNKIIPKSIGTIHVDQWLDTL